MHPQVPIVRATDRERTFVNDVRCNRHVAAILDRMHEVYLLDCWLVAGCPFQTIWNLRAGNAPEAFIRDYDIFYFDADRNTADDESEAQRRVADLLGDIDARIEVVNQARVHQWYERYFGAPYAPLRSTCEGIDRFLVLETCVGISAQEVYAPHGLDGVYAGTLTANPLAPHPALFQQKVASYRERWSKLRC
jgi:uncharacterized protein